MLDPNDEIESESAQLVDFKLIGSQVGYTIGSVRRHGGLVLALFTAIFAATMSSLVLLPKSYHVEAKLLAQRNQALALKGDSTNDALSRAAVETVMRRDNLHALLRQTDLLHEWYLRRAPLPHLKDVVVKALGKTETDEEKIEWMTQVLEKKMSVWTPSDGIIMIAIDWPDPAIALRLVDAAQQNYLEARQATEITAIAEQVSILENHAAVLRTDIDVAVDAIEKLRAERLAKPLPTSAARPPAAPAPVGPAPAPSSPPRTLAPPDPELAQLKVSIEAKQRAINDLEEFRRRRLSELNASLAEKRATYTDSHPIIIDLNQTIASLSDESPQVQALRSEVARLQKDFDQKSAAAAAESRAVPVINAGGPVGSAPPIPGSIIRIEQEPADDRDPSVMYARTRLRDAMDKYSTLRTQIETARIEFDTAEAAFKYRYSVIDPPLYPNKPDKPKAPLVVLAGVIGGLVVAVFAALAVDVQKGLFLERWQVERALDLPILGEVDLATLSKHNLQ